MRAVISEQHEAKQSLSKVTTQGARERHEGRAAGAQKRVTGKYVYGQMINNGARGLARQRNDWPENDGYSIIKLFGRSRDVNANALNEMMAEDLDLIFIKSILKETMDAKGLNRIIAEELDLTKERLPGDEERPSPGLVAGSLAICVIYNRKLLWRVQEFWAGHDLAMLFSRRTVQRVVEG